jgi:hypothetical protein
MTPQIGVRLRDSPAKNNRRIRVEFGQKAEVSDITQSVAEKSKPLAIFTI